MACAASRFGRRPQTRATRRAALALAAALALTSPAAAESLRPYNADVRQTSVSGISSGAAMAHQLHIAFSSIMVGAGLVAGVPYDCARDSIWRASGTCVEGDFPEEEVAGFVDDARRFAEAGAIDPLENLARQRVYLFSGTADERVVTAAVAATADVYRALGTPAAAIRFVDDVPAGHAFLTADFGNPCATSEPPFVNDCDLDQAGDILRVIYGELNPPAASPSGTLIEFDQHEFVADPRRYSMLDVGYAYLPTACAEGARCRIHVFLHGCRQSAEQIGDALIGHGGFNRWADTNAIIVLYPQATSRVSLRVFNPIGCWNFWGYAGDDDYAVRSGAQMAAIRSMIDRLAAGSQDGT